MFLKKKCILILISLFLMIFYIPVNADESLEVKCVNEEINIQENHDLFSNNYDDINSLEETLEIHINRFYSSNQIKDVCNDGENVFAISDENIYLIDNEKILRKNINEIIGRDEFGMFYDLIGYLDETYLVIYYSDCEKKGYSLFNVEEILNKKFKLSKEDKTYSKIAKSNEGICFLKKFDEGIELITLNDGKLVERLKIQNENFEKFIDIILKIDFIDKDKISIKTLDNKTYIFDSKEEK